MSYGLYISDGVNGSVITNSNNIFNEEYEFELTSQAISGGSSLDIQTNGAGNPALIGIFIEENTGLDADIEVERDSVNDILRIKNTGTSSQSVSAKLFRFQ